MIPTRLRANAIATGLRPTKRLNQLGIEMPITKLKSPVTLETAFNEYIVDEVVGEGGAGRVFGGKSGTGEAIAVKLLTSTAKDKRRRFKNEAAFLSRNQHRNVVTVLDHGVANHADITGPFYVMKRYDSNLRAALKSSMPPAYLLRAFAQVLDGVEAAHLQRVVHRDLKPENILFDRASDTLAIADFGVASFTTDELATLVQTGANQRLANFQYAAPEQRAVGQQVTEAADIYALGLMLNEMFTGHVPHGTDYALISSVSDAHGYLDDIVAQMLKQAAGQRPASIAEVKSLIQKYEFEAVSRQKLSQLDQTVIPVWTIDNPLALEPPKVLSANWDNNVLTLTLDRVVDGAWINELNGLGSYAAVMGVPPASARFSGSKAMLSCSDHDAQRAIDHFKSWLPSATVALKQRLERKVQDDEYRAREALKRAKEAEERKLRVNSQLRV